MRARFEDCKLLGGLLQVGLQTGASCALNYIGTQVEVALGKSTSPRIFKTPETDTIASVCLGGQHKALAVASRRVDQDKIHSTASTPGEQDDVEVWYDTLTDLDEMEEVWYDAHPVLDEEEDVRSESEMARDARIEAHIGLEEAQHPSEEGGSKRDAAKRDLSIGFSIKNELPSKIVRKSLERSPMSRERIRASIEKVVSEVDLSEVDLFQEAGPQARGNQKNFTHTDSRPQEREKLRIGRLILVMAELSKNSAVGFMIVLKKLFRSEQKEDLEDSRAKTSRKKPWEELK